MSDKPHYTVVAGPCVSDAMKAQGLDKMDIEIDDLTITWLRGPGWDEVYPPEETNARS